jgi:GTP-binding protein LepA
VSAKTGEGIQPLLDQICEKLPGPKAATTKKLRGLVFDAKYDEYRGVVMYVRIFDGQLKQGDKIRMMGSGRTFNVTELLRYTPFPQKVKVLDFAQVGSVCAGMKTLGDVRVGDTITLDARPASEPLPGFKAIKPRVFAGLFPVSSDDYESFRDALQKLKLNDSALHYEPEVSQALGFGFRCGFLGLLHMDIVQERLEREYDMDLITTAPSVVYQVLQRDGTVVEIDNPSKLPPSQEIASVSEPIVTARIHTPKEFVGVIIKMCEDRRGTQIDIKYMGEKRVQIVYELPLSEIVFDFFDKLKSASRGYASLDYEPTGLRQSPLVKLDILLAGEPVDALSMIVHRDSAYARGKGLVERLKETIPRQMFEVPVQAAIGGKIIARETVKAKRKDVLAKCYGGDISRKRKLLEKQKEGKKRMKHVGNVEVPQEAFLAVLQLDGSSAQ